MKNRSYCLLPIIIFFILAMQSNYINFFAAELSNKTEIASKKVVCMYDHIYCGNGEREDSCEEVKTDTKYPEKAIFGSSCESLDCISTCPLIF